MIIGKRALKYPLLKILRYMHRGLLNLATTNTKNMTFKRPYFYL